MAHNDQSPRSKLPLTILRIAVLVLIALMIIMVSILVWPSFMNRFQAANSTETGSSIESGSPTEYTVALTNTQTASPSPALILLERTETPTIPISDSNDGSQARKAAFLSVIELGYAHLFVFFPDEMDLMRITMGDWHDIEPAISPDGKKLAFSSNRSGNYDIFVMNLENGSIEQVTDSEQYESSPSWSPDGLWLAYEAYMPDEEGVNLEILIRPVDGSQNPYRLTEDPAADFSPAWSPRGRQIAYVSSSTGNLEIWLADLDKPSDRSINLSRLMESDETHPVWSPDGSELIWVSQAPHGVDILQKWVFEKPDDRVTTVANGSWSAWSSDKQELLAAYVTPNQTYLTGYRIENGKNLFPALPLSGEVLGITWGNGTISNELIEEFSAVAQITMPPLWLPRLQGETGDQQGRVPLAPLDGVRAPFAMLQDNADEAFISLRARVAEEAGWDFLSILENAYVPLTSPLEPGYIDDWLYTGRAIQVNSAPMTAGWMTVVRENFGSESYWRIYLRSRYQGGSQGKPLHRFPFDFEARHSGNPRAYEDGGSRFDEIPTGYWMDFTQLAGAYGWERLPSLSTWRISYSGIRYNQFYLGEGLDWFSAMLQVYPREVLNTSTPVLSPTPTPTPTNTPTTTPTLTRTPFLSPTPTITTTRRLLPTSTPEPRSSARD